MRLLVAIASYGTANDHHLARLVGQYRSMPYDVDIVVLSNIPKQVAGDVELIVGLPSKNPWSLPFGHKRLFSQRCDDYDLFIYTEDDILITERNIAAFLSATAKLPDREIAGFMRFELGQDGERYFPDALGFFHWSVNSVRTRQGATFAAFSNEHSACYILTRNQLKRAIASGGFLLEPYEDAYDMLCTAATDPYTRCGMEKLICISDINDFLVHHLSNRYVGTFSLHEASFCKQLQILLGATTDGILPALPILETKLPRQVYSKVYYEPPAPSLLSLIPKSARTVLSVGCGWGALESELRSLGLRVTAVPLDPVIGACAAARGVELVPGDFDSARAKLEGRHFDLLIFSNVLHLVPDPPELLAQFGSLLKAGGHAIVVVPNLSRLAVRWRRLRDKRYRILGTYDISGVHRTSKAAVRRWFTTAGLKCVGFDCPVDGRAALLNTATFGLGPQWVSTEIFAIASAPGSSAAAAAANTYQ